MEDDKESFLERYKDYHVIGLRERIKLYGNENKKIQLIAKIDTGAKSSSIDIKTASELKWGPLIKTVIIKSANGINRRAVVNGTIEINGVKITSPFTLSNRSHMKYKVIIGKETLKKGKFIIDISKGDKQDKEQENNMLSVSQNSSYKDK